MTKPKNKTFEEGSANVFADLDMPDASQKLAKTELALKINQLIKHRKLKQTESAKLLNVNQSKISLLNRGRLTDYSIERLIKFLNLLDQDVQIVVKRTRRKTSHGNLSVVYA